MTGQQKRAVFGTFFASLVCLIAPAVFQFMEGTETSQTFEGTISGTSIKAYEQNKNIRIPWRKILKIQEFNNLFWIYLDTKDGEKSFMIESYPELTRKLDLLKSGDIVRIVAAPDAMGRGHFFPRMVQRGSEIIYTYEEVRKHYDRPMRLIQYAGIILLFVGILEVLIYRRNNVKITDDLNKTSAQDE